MDYTKQDAEALITKIVDLDLSSGEQAALDALFEAASESEVQAFGLNRRPQYLSVLWPKPDLKPYIGETEKNVVFEPNDEP